MTDLRTLSIHQLEREASRCLARLLPRLADIFAAEESNARTAYFARLERHFDALFARLATLYGHHYDFYFHLEQLLIEMGQSWFERPTDLKIG
ncbi:MAG: hypothetical protein R2873_23070 [Caldilineaceae bacterium]